jgi:hypothetical protein
MAGRTEGGVRYYVIEVAGDNDALHRTWLARVVRVLRRTEKAGVRRAWVQTTDPTLDESLVEQARLRDEAA